MKHVRHSSYTLKENVPTLDELVGVAVESLKSGVRKSFTAKPKTTGPGFRIPFHVEYAPDTEADLAQSRTVVPKPKPEIKTYETRKQRKIELE